MTVSLQVRALQAKVEFLEFRLGELLGVNQICPIPEMTKTHFRLINLLARRSPNVVTHNALHHAMTDRPEQLKEPHNCLKVHISRLRTHLKPYGIEIKIDWGMGYRLEAADKAKWQALVDAANGQEAAA